MKTIKQKYTIRAPKKKVWQALVDPKIIEDWGGGPAKMSDKVDEHFSLWGGDIWGTNLVVIPHEKLVQEWYGGDWAEGSTVTFELKEKGGDTVVNLLHENLPDAEAKSFADGWHTDYMGPLKKLVEK